MSSDDPEIITRMIAERGSGVLRARLPQSPPDLPLRPLRSDYDLNPHYEHVAQELVPQPFALGCAGDQPWEIRDDERAIGVGARDAERRRERRERIIRDLRLRRRQP